MNFKDSQVQIVENLIDDRIYYLKENIGYCRNYLPECRTEHEFQSNHEAIQKSTVELHKLIEFKSYILANQEVTTK